jgi:hypothetical protein
MSATLTVTAAAALLGISRNSAFEAVRRDGELAGVPVIRVGRRLLVPRVPFFAVLGVDETADEESSG